MIKKNLLNMGSQKLINLSSVNILTSNLISDTTVNFANNLFSINSQERIGIKNTFPKYTFDVTGDINYTGNLYNNGVMVQTESSATSLWSTNGSGLVYYNAGTVVIGSNTNPGFYKLYVDGTVYFLGDLILGNNLSVSDDIICNNININNTCTTLNLTATGVTTLGNTNISNSLLVDDGITINTGDLDIVAGNIYAPNSKLTCDNLEVTNQSTFTSSIQFLDNVYITGKTNCDGDFIVNNKLVVNKTNGNLTTSGSINVGGSVNIDGTLNVLSDSVLNKLTVNNDLTVNGNLKSITGNSNFFDVGVENNLTVTNILDIDNNNFIVTPSNSQVLIGYTTNSSNSTNGALVVTGGVGVGGNLNVNGIITSTLGTSTFSNITIDGTLVCDGTATFNNKVETFDNLTVNSDIICVYGGSGTGKVSCKNLDINSNLTVDDLGNLDTVGNVSIDGNLQIGGDVFISGNLDLTNTSGNFSGGIITNSRFIDGSVNPYQVSNNYSGSTFIINSHGTLTINLPTTILPGTYFKFICGPNYSSTGILTIVSVSDIFGMSQNNTTLSSIPSLKTIIKFNNNSSGDYVEVSGVYVDSLNTGYNVNTKSVESDGFTFS